MQENSLVVQWVEFCTFTAGAQVQSLVGELRSHKLHNKAKFEKRNGNSLWAPEWEGDLEHHGPSTASAKQAGLLRIPILTLTRTVLSSVLCTEGHIGFC